LSKTVLEHARMWLLPDGRVVVVLISPGGNTRDKILAAAPALHAGRTRYTADFLNRHYSGWTLEAIRADAAAKAGDRAGALRGHRAERPFTL